MDWKLLEDFVEALEWYDIVIISVNLLLFVFARKLLEVLFKNRMESAALTWRLSLLRGLNVLVIGIYGYFYFYLPADNRSIAIKAMSTIVIFYFAYSLSHILRFMIYRRFGRKREVEGNIEYGITYKTRLFTILANGFIGIVCFVSVINFLGFDSLLKAGGVIGVIGVMLGLTQAAWAPDIISGMIILNSDLFEEGDVVMLGRGNEQWFGRVYRTKLFHSEFMDLVTNERVMVRNTSLREMTLRNLSKCASARGLRECLSFDIGYDVSADDVVPMLQAAHASAVANEEVHLEEGSECEVRVLSTGPHAVSWGLIYPLTEVAEVVEVRRRMREQVLKTAAEHGITLATPLTHTVQRSALKDESHDDAGVEKVGKSDKEKRKTTEKGA